MAHLDTSSDSLVLDLEDDRPLAVRRKRRISSGLITNQIGRPLPPNNERPSQAGGMQTPPATPHRTEKRVRFSDPGPNALSSGLTPFINRTSISSPPSSRSRRFSTPPRRWNLSVDDTPTSETLQFAPLRQVLEGRVKRRLRRNHLSEEINHIESEKRRENTGRKAEIQRLRDELRQKDLEIEYLRDDHDLASQIGDEAGTARPDLVRADQLIRSLESHITELKAELDRREADAAVRDADWTIAARDPFNYDDETFLIPNYESDFRTELSELVHSTPLQGSFPSPPATMPNTPNKPASVHDAGIQVSTPVHDPQRLLLESQLATLQSELKTLSTALELTNTAHERLSAKLSPFSSPSDSSSLDAALDTVLTELALTQSAAKDSSAQYCALTTSLRTLGFPTSSPDGLITLLNTQFRQARLELEYLQPGETPEGFNNSTLLSLLISRLRALVAKTTQQDSLIDEYHEQELSLRSQLSARIDVATDLQKSLAVANDEATILSAEVKDRDESITKLARALDGYRTEVKALEALITKLEAERHAATAQYEEQLVDADLRYDSLKAVSEGQEAIINAMHERLAMTLQAASIVSVELTACTKRLNEVHDAAAAREVEHGEALRLRDARVQELRGEVETVNEALRRAHEGMAVLMREKAAMMREMKVLEQDGKLVERVREVLGQAGGDGQEKDRAVVRKEGPRWLDSGLARRESFGGNAKKRRRYDSGLGFLDEAEEGTTV